MASTPTTSDDIDDAGTADQDEWLRRYRIGEVVMQALAWHELMVCDYGDTTAPTD